MSALAVVLAIGACGGEQTPAERYAADAVADRIDSVRLHVLDCGRAEIADLGRFDRGGAYTGRRHTATVPCFLIRHPNGDLLWDTGLPDSLHAEPRGVERNAIRFFVARTLRDQLAELGLEPEDVELLALSHAHFDHAGNANDFAGATWLVDAAERAYMFRAAARTDALAFGSYANLEQARTITFTEDYDVFGDGAVTIVRTPGHTPGHASLLVRLDRAGAVLLSGDLYHLREARQRRTVPVGNVDPDETLRSMARFEALAAATGARVVIQHDAADVGELPASPSFLD